MLEVVLVPRHLDLVATQLIRLSRGATKRGHGYAVARLLAARLSPETEAPVTDVASCRARTREAPLVHSRSVTGVNQLVGDIT